MHSLEVIQHKNTQQVLKEYREALALDSTAGYEKARQIAKSNPDLFVGDGRVRPSEKHDVLIVCPGRPFAEITNYWRTCSCGDEGGPHENYNEAWDATVDHERGSK